MAQPDNWASWGNRSLNFICTGDFERGIPNRRSVMLYGESGAGKSLLLGKAAKSIQDQGYPLVYIDTEDAIDPEFLTRIGVDINEDNGMFLPVRVSTVEELTSAMSLIFQMFGADQKVGIIIDSLGMTETKDHQETFDKKGELKNDMGLLAKKFKKFLKNINPQIAARDCYCLVAQHSYLNQDVTNGKGVHIVSGGQAQVYIPSITMQLSKLKLKEDGKVTGIRIKAETAKTRFTQTHRNTELKVSWLNGVQLNDGVIQLLETYYPDILSKAGAWYSYELDGKEVKFQSKNLDDHADTLISLVGEVEIVESDDDEVDENE